MTTTGSDEVFEWDIAAITGEAATELLRKPASDVRTVITVNAATMHLATTHPDLARAVERATLRVADGMGVVWSWRILGRRLPERVAGIDLMVRLIAAAETDGRSVYLLGATPEVLGELVAVLAERFPALNVAGSRDGYFDAEQGGTVIDTIRESGADLLFIGMPSPFKEVWAEEHRDEFGVDLILGVGGSFDVIAGFTPRAPSLLQRTGLEWAWRLACEPRRMWRRYLRVNVWLAGWLLRSSFRRRHTA